MSNRSVPIGRLRRVSEPQRRAVIAFCQELLAEPAASDTAAAALDAVTGPAVDLSRRDIPSLLSTTRRMVAVSLPEISGAAERRAAVAASTAGEEQSTCGETAVLLAASLNRVIAPRDSAALERHLAGCRACRSVRAHYLAADAELASAFMDRPQESPAILPVAAQPADVLPLPDVVEPSARDQHPPVDRDLARRWLLADPGNASEPTQSS